MSDFLLELFSEEIPARMQRTTPYELVAKISEVLGETGVEPKIFITPRRIAVIIENLPTIQADINTELKGPKIDATEAAVNGFLKKNNITIEQLEKRDGIYFASIHQKGRPTIEILKDAIEKILNEITWQKSMRWGSGEARWVRPLHSILAIFDGKIVPIEFAGIKAGNTTFGHRFLAPQAITINSANEYEKSLKDAFVIADREKRKREIIKQSTTIATAQNLTIKEDFALLEEVVGLVEYPQVFLGKIDDKFMDLPPEVLTMVMRSHQKYFALQNVDGTLSSNFLITSNMQTADAGKAIIAGNERVLRARFADARFFWDTDRKKPLSEWADGLKTVTYHAKIGTIAEKVERVKTLAVALAEYVPNADKELVVRAATLCKADLTTGMVGEFAELQGIMGRYYALQQGENQAVADAIRDHYKPLGAGDSVPFAPVSICVALADKLDTLISMFAINEKPTGSKDPFALRRAALGVIRIVLENGIRLPLSIVIPAQPCLEKLAGIQSDLLTFFHDRLKVILKEQNIRHDVINAVIANGDDDLVRVVKKAKTLQEFVETDDGKNLLAAYKRANNIVSAEEKKDGISYSSEKLNTKILEDEKEKSFSLHLGISAERLENFSKHENYHEMLQELSSLRESLDRFFDAVMINCDEKELRKERLHLLARFRDITNTIADFSQIEG